MFRDEKVDQKGILVPYLLYISQSLGVKQNQGMVWLCRVRHTPHPDSLGVRLHRGSNREACRASGEVVIDERSDNKRCS